MNSSRSTIGRYSRDRIMSSSGSTRFYLDGKTIKASNNSSIGYTDENIENYLDEVVAYIVFFSDWR
jgi:adenylylsulfate kinase-like enzyme